MNLEATDFIINFVRIFFINVGTYYINFRLIDKKINKKPMRIIIITLLILSISIICNTIKIKIGFFYSTFFVVLFLSKLFSKETTNDYVYSLLITLISLSLNYIIFFMSIAINFFPNIALRVDNKYINLMTIIITQIFLIKLFLKIKRFKKGFAFLQNNLKNEYFNILILNISIIILFLIILLSNYNEIFTNNIFWAIIITSIIMFITIKKSIQIYYKQKLLVQELNETKEELEKKKQEIEQLEKENLNFSKTSHSIAHNQKALEHKLNELILKNEIASEIDIKDRVNTISKEINNKVTEVELSKTDIPEIDDMLKYMQSECIKNKIDLQLQLSGNIYYMTNNYIAKENLEILLADHIKNAIIAINYSDNINRSILVRLGNIDGVYSLYVYDSGIEFEIDTLLNLGRKPSTTHADNGGTGMGFMNTFDTLNKYKASIAINEYSRPCKDNFTKSIVIKFDKKNEYKIVSYRYEEIHKQASNEDIIIEKIML